MASKKHLVFLVDDEPIQNEMLKDYLSERFSYELKTFENGEDMLKQMGLKPDIVVLDYHLNANDPKVKNGVEILKDIKAVNPDTRVVMLSGQDKLDVAVDSMKYGAYDYVVKGETAFTRMENILGNIGEIHQMKDINSTYRRTIIWLSVIVGLVILLSIWLVTHMQGGGM
jgi:DNA-binding NtrC family response regulator